MELEVHGQDQARAADDALLATLQLDTTAATAQRIVSRPCLILPMDFKLQLRNMSGVAFGGTLNTLKYRRFFDQGV